MSHDVIASGLGSPEGPVVGPGDWVLNVCSFTPEDRRWPTRGGDITATRLGAPRRTSTVFNTSTTDVTGIPAALAFGPDGCLYVTDEGRRAIVRVDPDRAQTDFIREFDGQRINGPNDLSFDPDGNLFFTDPWGSTPEHRIGAVYGYDWQRAELHRIRDGMAFPNGIVAHDGCLYVAETHTMTIWVHDIVGPGQAGDPTEFCRLPDVETPGWKGPDGMAVDCEGNLWVGHLGSGNVLAYDRDGNRIDQVPVGGIRPTNVCFAGPDRRTLLVTVDDLGQIVSIPVGVAGERLNFCPSGMETHPWTDRLAGLEQDSDG